MSLSEPAVRVLVASFSEDTVLELIITRLSVCGSQ